MVLWNMLAVFCDFVFIGYNINGIYFNIRSMQGDHKWNQKEINEEIKRCKQDPKYFAQNYCLIKTKTGNYLDFKDFNFDGYKARYKAFNFDRYYKARYKARYKAFLTNLIKLQNKHEEIF